MPAISCDPNDLLSAAACYKCVPVGEQNSVIIYLLQQLAGNTQTTDQLMQSAACLKCIPAGMQAEIQTYLLCELKNSSDMNANLLAAGTAQLVNGSVTIYTRFASINNSILVTGYSPTITVPPHNYTNVVEGVSFQINSSVSSDQNLVSWAVLKPFNP